MQHRDDQPPVSSRPSLLSSEQQAEADRLRAQNKPDAKPALNQAPRRSTGSIIAAGVLVAACAGAAVWMFGGEEDKPLVAATRAPAAAPLAVSAPAAASASASASSDPEVSVAAILNEAPAPKQESLSEMLSAPGQAEGVKASDREELNQLLEASAPSSPRLAAKAEPKALVRAPAPKDKARDTKLAARKIDKSDKNDKKNKNDKSDKKDSARLAASKNAPAKNVAPKKKEAPAPSAQVDNDVTLLAALVAHSHRESTARTESLRKLAQCKTLGASAAEQCRARLCAGSARDVPECKAPRLVKTAATP